MKKSKTVTPKRTKNTKTTKAKNTYEIFTYEQAAANGVCYDMFSDEFVVIVNGKPYVNPRNSWGDPTYYRSRAAARKAITRLRRKNK